LYINADTVIHGNEWQYLVMFGDEWFGYAWQSKAAFKVRNKYMEQIKTIKYGGTNEDS